jgi:hypothetical protein
MDGDGFPEDLFGLDEGPQSVEGEVNDAVRVPAGLFDQLGDEQLEADCLPDPPGAAEDADGRFFAELEGEGSWTVG